jgi:hypothetical protein
VPTTVVDEGEVGEAGHTRRWGHAWHKRGSTWSHMARAKVLRPRVAQVKARAEASVSEPHVTRAKAQDWESGVEVELDRTQEESRYRWVGRSQQGETHLRQKQCVDR